MNRLLKLIRGVIGTGLTWAIGWAGLWAALFLVMRGFGLMEEWYFWYPVGVTAVIGFIAGSSFGVILSVLERHKKLEDLSLWRIALWGGLGGLALVAVIGVKYLAPAIVLTLLGVGSATGSVALTRRGSETKLIEGDDRSLPTLEGD